MLSERLGFFLFGLFIGMGIILIYAIIRGKDAFVSNEVKEK